MVVGGGFVALLLSIALVSMLADMVAGPGPASAAQGERCDLETYQPRQLQCKSAEMVD